ncbi:MAG: SymE family type I addiction module toxin [Anaerovoracaceae bacterium]
MKEKKKRRLKVYGQSNGYNYQDVPTIVLKGKWLETAGFNIGDHISIKSEDGQIIINRIIGTNLPSGGMH